MIVKDTVVKTVTADGRTVYDLDAVGKSVTAVADSLVMPPTINLLPTMNAAAAIGASVQKIANFSESLMLNQQFRVMQQLSESILGPYRVMQQALATSLASELQKPLVKSLAINFQFKPLGLTPVLQVEEPVEARIEASNGALNVIIDRFGFFWLGGQKITRANARSSRHGQLLNWFEGNKGELVSEEEMKNYLKVTDPKQVMKYLKKDLRELGYKLWYERHRRQGVIYRGVLKKQKQ